MAFHMVTKYYIKNWHLLFIVHITQLEANAELISFKDFRSNRGTQGCPSFELSLFTLTWRNIHSDNEMHTQLRL